MEPYRQGKARRFSINRRDVGKGVMIHQRVRICPALSYNHTVQLHWIFRILNIKQGEFQALVPGPASIAPPAAAGIGYSILSDSEKKILAYWMEIIRITADLKLSGYMRGRRVFQINNIERVRNPECHQIGPVSKEAGGIKPLAGFPYRFRMRVVRKTGNLHKTPFSS